MKVDDADKKGVYPVIAQWDNGKYVVLVGPHTESEDYDTYEMAVDCLVRIAQTIIKNKIDSLREKLRDTDDNMDILSQLSTLEKDTNDIALKYATK